MKAPNRIWLDKHCIIDNPELLAKNHNFTEYISRDKVVEIIEELWKGEYGWDDALDAVLDKLGEDDEKRHR
jgi:hypothetical protein